MSRLATWVVLVVVACAGGRAGAWDYEWHRLINETALTLLPTNFPGWATVPQARERIAFMAGEMDRWRNTAHYPLRHANNPDHYLDVDDLPALGLTVTNLPMFRYDFVALVTRARLEHPERFPAISPGTDAEHVRMLPGFLPWSIAEQYGRLKAMFSSLRSFEAMGSPEEVANARATIIGAMGVLGHPVGDAAQPLHTSHSYNGWVGPNPDGYTTNRTFHSWIDTGYLRKVGTSVDAVRARARPARVLPAAPKPDDDPVFRRACGYVGEQFERLEPLYRLEKAGALTGEGPAGTDGRLFLEEQLARAAVFLADLWLTAWEQAPVDAFLQGQLLQRKNATPP